MALDALQLAAVIVLDVDQVVTYDVRMRAAVAGLGLRVTRPGVKQPTLSVALHHGVQTG